MEMINIPPNQGITNARFQLQAAVRDKLHVSNGDVDTLEVYLSAVRVETLRMEARLLRSGLNSRLRRHGVLIDNVK